MQGRRSSGLPLFPNLFHNPTTSKRKKRVISSTTASSWLCTVRARRRRGSNEQWAGATPCGYQSLICYLSTMGCLVKMHWLSSDAWDKLCSKCHYITWMKISWSLDAFNTSFGSRFFSYLDAHDLVLARASSPVQDMVASKKIRRGPRRQTKEERRQMKFFEKEKRPLTLKFEGGFITPPSVVFRRLRSVKSSSPSLGFQLDSVTHHFRRLRLERWAWGKFGSNEKDAD